MCLKFTTSLQLELQLDLILWKGLNAPVQGFLTHFPTAQITTRV